ncbi:MAG: type II toxin-antitoxin system VapC family toxin [Verrucomicrobiales bacterium]
MKSLDTNILVHALDTGSPYHSACFPIYESLLRDRNEWLVADQMLFELYRLLRNPVVFKNPLGASQATGLIERIRNGGAAMHCAYDARLWPRVMDLLRRFPDRKGDLVFDAALAVTLQSKGVKTFYTRNTRDYQAFEMFDVVDPVAED